MNDVSITLMIELLDDGDRIDHWSKVQTRDCARKWANLEGELGGRLHDKTENRLKVSKVKY